MDKIGAYTGTADTNDEFTEGNPSTGTPATEVDGGWLNAVQRELVKVIESMGLTLDDADDTLLWQAFEGTYGKTFAGDPNGNVAANVLRERCWDTSGPLPVLYIATAADGTAAGSTWKEFSETISARKDIGEVFALQTDITGVSEPDNTGKAKYIKLTAGEDGAGEYNEGLLTGESVSGSSPTITATAVIDHTDSPMDGQTVHLINTERRFLRAGNPGATQNSQFESHDHGGGNHDHDYKRSSNAAAGSDVTTDNGTGTPTNNIIENSGNIINPNGGDETRPRNIGITYYMRIA